MQELMVLRAADHPNIVKLYEIYLDHEYLHLVTELLSGGTVCPEFTEFNKYTE